MKRKLSSPSDDTPAFKKSKPIATTNDAPQFKDASTSFAALEWLPQLIQITKRNQSRNSELIRKIIFQCDDFLQKNDGLEAAVLVHPSIRALYSLSRDDISQVMNKDFCLARLYNEENKHLLRLLQLQTGMACISLTRSFHAVAMILEFIRRGRIDCYSANIEESGFDELSEAEMGVRDYIFGTFGFQREEKLFADAMDSNEIFSVCMVLDVDVLAKNPIPFVPISSAYSICVLFPRNPSDTDFMVAITVKADYKDEFRSFSYYRKYSSPVVNSFLHLCTKKNNTALWQGDPFIYTKGYFAISSEDRWGPDDIIHVTVTLIQLGEILIVCAYVKNINSKYLHPSILKFENNKKKVPVVFPSVIFISSCNLANDHYEKIASTFVEHTFVFEVRAYVASLNEKREFGVEMHVEGICSTSFVSAFVMSKLMRNVAKELVHRCVTDGNVLDNVDSDFKGLRSVLLYAEEASMPDTLRDSLKIYQPNEKCFRSNQNGPFLL